jgi:RNA polymerase sigma-70 factor (ECF subfamily)
MVATDLGRAARLAEEHAAFDVLYERHKGPLYNYIYRLMGQRDQADDLLQETFVRVYRALDHLPAEPGRTPWLYRIATNACYDVLRRRRLLTWLPWRRDDDLSAPISTATSGDIGEGYAMHEEIQQALRRVPLSLRAPLLLHTLHGFTYADIAQTLGLSEAAVKMRVSRARAAFRRVYRGGDKELEP